MSSASPLTQRSRWLHAAILEATGRASTTEIAQAVGVKPYTLEGWRSNPEYKELVTGERLKVFETVGSQLREQMRAAGAAIQESRIADYDLIRQLALDTIEARKVDAKEQWAAWQAFEAKRLELLAFVETCREALLESDREDSESYAQAEVDLKKAEGELSSHVRYSRVGKPPREALLGAMARDIKSVGKEAVEVWKWDDAPLRTLMAADKQAAEDLGQWLQKLKVDVSELSDEQVLRLLAGQSATEESGGE